MRPLFLAATSALLIGGCTIDARMIRARRYKSSARRIAWRRIVSHRIVWPPIVSRRIASHRTELTNTQLVANPASSEILNSEAGRDVYSYIVSCALPAGTTIEADIPGAAFPDTAPPQSPYTCVNNHCTFPGNLNLAPKWTDHKLDSKGQGWISACLFSRVNANQIAEAISLRGTHMGLTVSLDEMELYTMEEGAFYGNLFIDDPNPNTKPDWHACRGAGKAACMGDIGCGGLGNRDCAAENPATPGYTYCGFKYAGDCRDFTPAVPSAYACRTWDSAAGIYGDCYEKSGKNGQPNGCTKKYREVITTFVSPD